MGHITAEQSHLLLSVFNELKKRPRAQGAENSNQKTNEEQSQKHTVEDKAAATNIVPVAVAI